MAPLDSSNSMLQANFAISSLDNSSFFNFVSDLINATTKEDELAKPPPSSDSPKEANSIGSLKSNFCRHFLIIGCEIESIERYSSLEL